MKPSDEIRASPRRAIPLTFCKEIAVAPMNELIRVLLLFSIPLALIAFLPIGWLRSYSVFLAVGVFYYLAVAALFFSAAAASGLAAGSGGGGSEHVEPTTPLILWGIWGSILIFFGILVRPNKKEEASKNHADKPRLRTLREAQTEKQKKQNKAEMATPRKPSD